MRKLIQATLFIAALVLNAALADEIKYLDAPDTFPAVTAGLNTEFGTTNFPPLGETTLSYYQVPGTGPLETQFRFHSDTGAFRFTFGYYHFSPSLNATDTSTDAGKAAYATQALAPGNAVVVFDNLVENPGISKALTLSGGDMLGFFLIPDGTLAAFQGSPGDFDVNGVGSPTLGVDGPNRWPLFGFAPANPAGLDQLMSFDGTSLASGKPSNLFPWEDLTRATLPGNPFPSDVHFNDLVFGVEGLVPTTVPEPAGLPIIGIAAAALLTLRRRSTSVGPNPNMKFGPRSL